MLTGRSYDDGGSCAIVRPCSVASQDGHPPLSPAPATAQKAVQRRFVVTASLPRTSAKLRMETEPCRLTREESSGGP
jgi:hypothetical protein